MFGEFNIILYSDKFKVQMFSLSQNRLGFFSGANLGNPIHGVTMVKHILLYADSYGIRKVPFYRSIRSSFYRFHRKVAKSRHHHLF